MVLFYTMGFVLHYGTFDSVFHYGYFSAMFYTMGQTAMFYTMGVRVGRARSGPFGAVHVKAYLP
jgi:hypothetical protein